MRVRVRVRVRVRGTSRRHRISAGTWPSSSWYVPAGHGSQDVRFLYAVPPAFWTCRVRVTVRD